MREKSAYWLTILSSSDGAREEDEVLVLGEVVELAAVLGRAIEHLGREDVRALVAETSRSAPRHQLGART